MVYTYVPGPIHEADTSAAVQLRQAATELMSGMTRRCLDGTVPAARPDERPFSLGTMHQPLGSVVAQELTARRGQDTGPVVSVNSAAAPRWSAALDIGRQVTAGNPLPGASHMPFKASQNADLQLVGDGSRSYRPPVQLIVLDSQLQRLGPSTPFRYTAATAPNVDTQHLQQQLLSPVSAPAGSSMRWAADAGTQTTPDWLAADAQRLAGMPLGSWSPGAASAAGSMLQEAGYLRHRPATAGGILQSTGVRGSSSSPWRLVTRSPQIQLQGPVAAAVGSKPWVPGGAADNAVTAEFAASAAMAWKAKQTAARSAPDSKEASAISPVAATRHKLVSNKCSKSSSCGGSCNQRASSPASRRLAAQRAHEKARQQVDVSARYAAIGRAAARENAELAAKLMQQQQQQEQQQQSDFLNSTCSPCSRCKTTAAANSAPQQCGAENKHFKTIPPPMQPWRPAGAASKDGNASLQLQQHTALKVSGGSQAASGSPRSLRELINRINQRPVTHTRQHGAPAVLGSSARLLCGSRVPGRADSEHVGLDDSTSVGVLSCTCSLSSVNNSWIELAAAAGAGNTVSPNIVAAEAAVNDGLAQLQALLQETSGEEEIMFKESWQLFAAPQAASTVTAPAGDSSFNHLVLSSSTAPCMSDVTVPSAHQQAASFVGTNDDIVMPLQAAQSNHTASGEQTTMDSAVGTGSSMGTHCEQPGSPGIRFDRVHLSNPVRRMPAAAAGTEALPGRPHHLDGTGWPQCAGTGSGGGTMTANSDAVVNTSISSLEGYLTATLGQELAALVLHQPQGQVSVLGDCAYREPGLVRFPRLTQQAPPTEQQQGIQCCSSGCLKDCSTDASWAAAAAATTYSTSSGTCSHRGSASGDLVAQHNYSGNVCSSISSLPKTDSSDDDSAAAVTPWHQQGSGTPPAARTDLQDLQVAANSSKQHKCHHGVSGHLVQCNVGYTGKNGTADSLRNSGSAVCCGLCSETSDTKCQGSYLAKISDSEAEFLVLEEQLAVAAAAMQRSAERLQPLHTVHGMQVANGVEQL